MCEAARIADIIQPEAVRISGVLFRSKGALYRVIASIAEAAYTDTARSSAAKGQIHGVGEDTPVVTAKDVATALNARSKQFPPEFCDGILLPTGHSPKMTSFISVFLRLKRPATITMPDNRPADLVFALLGPQDEARTDLKLLAYVAHILKRPQMQKKLRNAKSAALLYTILTDVSLPPSVVKRLPSAADSSR